MYVDDYYVAKLDIFPSFCEHICLSYSVNAHIHGSLGKDVNVGVEILSEWQRICKQNPDVNVDTHSIAYHGNTKTQKEVDSPDQFHYINTYCYDFVTCNYIPLRIAYFQAKSENLNLINKISQKQTKETGASSVDFVPTVKTQPNKGEQVPFCMK